MKLVQHLPKLIVRIRIYSSNSSSSQKAFYINLEETTTEDVLTFVRNAIIGNVRISPFWEGEKIRVDIREYFYDGPIKGRSKTISFKGLSTQETYNLLLENIK